MPAEALGICPGAENIAVADFCLRALKPYLDELNEELFNRSRPVEENGWYYFCELGGEILLRNSAYFSARTPRDYDYGSGITVYPLAGKELNIKKEVGEIFRKIESEDLDRVYSGSFADMNRFMICRDGKGFCGQWGG